MRSKSLLVFVALLALASVVLVVPAAVGAPAGAPGTYIVQMAQSPVVAYTGGVAGFNATKPAKGQKINPASPDVVKYVGHLKATHDVALSSVGGGQKLYDYAYTYNGFAAKLSEAQAAELEKTSGVLAVTADELREVDTSSTPTFLGLTAAGGLWDQLGGASGGGKANAPAGPGEDIIIGVIDSGVWPESRSFSDRDGNGKLVYQQIPGFHGKCESAENVTDGSLWDANLCNKKLIAAQHFNAAWGGDAAVEAQRPWEFMSPRDYNGHGTHTSSTAGGNNGVQTTGPAAVFGPISGIAPRARIAMYKSLWSTQDAATASGFNADLVEAVDTAVADGVDVINYSISGTTTNFRDPVEIAFLFAADAGVFVAASAGNSGPTVGTVAHPSPWITTVAAGTHNRNGLGSVTLGNAATYNGASIASAVGPRPLILSTAAPAPGASAAAVNLCFSAAANGGTPALDPAVVNGKIVVCERGTNARVDKSLAVQQAGGVGMILTNPSPNSLNADLHLVPTVHVSDTDRGPIRAYAAMAGATATINQSTVTFSDPAPFTAAFSSRGPLTAGGGDLLKPDVIAPGQDVLAATAPPGQFGLNFNVLSGTSMSSPHVAGLAALLKDKHPTWSPMMIKSALMTSGYDVLDTSISDATRIFRQGAGHVRPNSAADPGLVFDSGINDWFRLICAKQPENLAALCGSLAPIPDASDFNVASIAIGDLAGSQTVKRTVKSVHSASEQYTVSHTGLVGFNVTLPANFTIGAGATQQLNFTFTRTTATLNAYTGGQITLTGDDDHVVRIPVVIRPVAIAAPLEVSGNGGAINYNVTFGYSGPFGATARGLVPATVTADTVLDDPTDSTCSLTSPNAKQYPVAIPAGQSVIRFQLFDADVAPGSDIDMCVFQGTALVGVSTSGTSAEVVTFNAGTGVFGALNLTVVVQGWGVPGSSPFKLHQWLLGTANAGNMTVVAPAAAVQGTTGNINLTFAGLAASTKYLGSVAYTGAASVTNPTIVRVDTP